METWSQWLDFTRSLLTLGLAVATLFLALKVKSLAHAHGELLKLVISMKERGDATSKYLVDFMKVVHSKWDHDDKLKELKNCTVDMANVDTSQLSAQPAAIECMSPSPAPSVSSSSPTTPTGTPSL